MNKLKTFLPFIIGTCIAIGVLIGSYLNFNSNTTAFLGLNNPKEAKIKRLINYIQYDYVDYVDTDSLLDAAIKNMLAKLDPHSVYLPPDRRKQINEEMDGKFVGVGIQFLMFKDSLTVSKVIPNGPSAKAGLLPGDRILTADNDTLYGKNLKNAFIIKTLKGKADTKVKLKIYRKVDNKFITTTVTRGEVPIKSVDASYMLNDSLGYIKLNKFTATSYSEFKSALLQLKQKGMKALVFDLRGNPGGYLQIADKIADEFLADGKLIVSTKNKGGVIEKTYATKKGSLEKTPVYVLIDEGSASASEIIAGALQDNDRGTIIGRRSFGKGLVQREMSLGDGSSIRLTTARYYTPTGRSIQKPYNHKGNKGYFNELEKRYRNGELVNADSIKVVDSLKFVTPKGKVVYGGGGIIPDVFVPIDTVGYLNGLYFNSLNNFVFDYVDKHRADFKDLTFKIFKRNFDKDNKILNTYLKRLSGFVKPHKIPKKQIKFYLKAVFARELFDNNAFYEMYNKEDDMIAKVLSLK
ncbi:MAG: S41 family peptidase [Flavobacteriaceae bacterium]|nr:S41 family peptidase [Flavobacteriaceae bacterium]